MKKEEKHRVWWISFYKQGKSKWRGCATLFKRQTMGWDFEVKLLCAIAPFCSCHWECEQQRAAWIHKYKLEGAHLSVIKGAQRSLVCISGFPAHLSAPVWQPCGAQRAGDCDQQKPYHRTTQGTPVQEVGSKRIVEWKVIDQQQPSSR